MLLFTGARKRTRDSGSIFSMVIPATPLRWPGWQHHRQTVTMACPRRCARSRQVRQEIVLIELEPFSPRELPRRDFRDGVGRDGVRERVARPCGDRHHATVARHPLDATGLAGPDGTARPVPAVPMAPAGTRRANGIAVARWATASCSGDRAPSIVPRGPRPGHALLRDRDHDPLCQLDEPARIAPLVVVPRDRP